MGWEIRGGKRYYYRKQREGGRVVSVYLGAGATAERLAACAVARRQEDAQVREADQ